MKPIQELKQELKEKLGLGIDIAIKALKTNIPADLAKYNEVILLEGRYRELHKKMLDDVMDDDQARREQNMLREAVLNFIDELEEKDFVKQTPQQQAQANAKKGKILYRIPDHMQVQKEVKCLIRIAFNEEILLQDLEKSADDAIKDVRIAEVMGVELLDPNEQPAFAIRTFSEKIQLIDELDVTEWLFYVKPLLEGTYPLLIKVAVVEIVDGLERKREVVLEEIVQVVAVEVAEQKEEKFAVADYDVHTAGVGVGAATAAPKAPGIGMPSQLRKAGMVAMVVLGFGAVMAIVAYFSDWNPFKEDPKEMIDENGSGGKGKGGGRVSDFSKDTSSVIILPTLEEYLDSATRNDVAPLLPGIDYVWKEDTLFLATNEATNQLPLQLTLIDIKSNATLLQDDLITIGEFIFHKVDRETLPGGLKLTVEDNTGQKQEIVVNLPEHLQQIAQTDPKKPADKPTTTNTTKPPKPPVNKPGTKPGTTKPTNTRPANSTDNNNTNNGTESNNTANTNATSNNEVNKDAANPPLITFDKAARAPIYKNCNTRSLQRATGDKLLKELERAKSCTKNSIASYVQRELSKTPEAISNNAVKRVTVVFTIDKEGKVKVVNIVQDFGTDFKEKVRKVVEEMPTFIAAQDEKGKVIPVSYSLPIIFKPN